MYERSDYEDDINTDINFGNPMFHRRLRTGTAI